jgi:hypothetical protein
LYITKIDDIVEGRLEDDEKWILGKIR